MSHIDPFLIFFFFLHCKLPRPKCEFPLRGILRVSSAGKLVVSAWRERAKKSIVRSEWIKSDHRR